MSKNIENKRKRNGLEKVGKGNGLCDRRIVGWKIKGVKILGGKLDNERKWDRVE